MAPRAIDGLIRPGRAEAARVLAVTIHTRPAYDQPTRTAEAVAAAAVALSDMAGDATFLNTGRWSAGDRPGWTPLTGTTFDRGVIGHDARHTFTFRVEEGD